MAAIKDAWGKHLVLVFRGQKVSQDDQLRFASYFGDLGTRKKAPEALRARTEGVQQDHEKVLLVSNIKVDGKPIGAFGEGEFWFHIDSGYTPRPYKYTFLYALELPSTGGNTMFSNMYKAYEAVPPALKEKLKGKKALHIHEYNRAKQANSSGDISGIPHYAHPVFITHPDTGRKTLFVDRLMTTRIEGVEPGRERRHPRSALRDRRAARIHLRARLAARRFPDVGQPLHHPRPHRLSEGGAPAAAPLHGRGRAAVRIDGERSCQIHAAQRLPVFEKFIGDLRAIWAAETDDQRRMERAKPLLEQLVMDAEPEGAFGELAVHRRPQEPAALCRSRPRLRRQRRGAHARAHRQRARSRRRLGALRRARRHARASSATSASTTAAVPAMPRCKLASVTTGSQGKVDLVPPRAIHAEQGGPTRSVAIIVRSQKLGEGTVLQHHYDRDDQHRDRALRPDANSLRPRRVIAS